MIGRRALWAISFLCFTCLPMLAQSGKGTVAGTVTDHQGRSLQGALVSVDPGGASTLTGSNGQYTITGLSAPASYKVTVTYAGFADSIQQHDFKAGETDKMDFNLSVASTSDAVQVYAGRQGGEVEAINRTFNSDNVINVLPADVITSLPNANVADAIGRLPSVSVERDEGEAKYVQVRGTEPRLTHTTLDGVTIASPETVRQIKLDLIPADLVESVQINKTLQANQEGDGIGGQVDLRTKSAESRPTVALEGIGGYTPIIGGRAQWMIDGTVGKRFLEGGKLGALIGLTYDYNGRGINDVEPGPVLTGTYDLRDYFYYRNRRGLAGTLDYRFNDTSSIYLKGLYSYFQNFGEDSIYSPAIQNTQLDASGNQVNYGFVSALQGDGHGTIGFQQLLRRPVQDIGGAQLGGHTVIKQSVLAWDLDASVARTRDDGYSDAYFSPSSSNMNNPLNNIAYGINVNNPLVPVIQVQNGVNIYDSNNTFLKQIQRQYTYNPEVDLGFGASLLTPYTIAGHASTFEFGGRFRNEHKFENQDTREFYPTAANPEDPSLAQSNFLSAFTDPNYYGGNYGPYGPGVNFNKVSAFPNIVDGGVAGGDILGNSFNQLEKVSAGYLMNTINVNKFRFIAGVRFEATSENNLGYDGAGNAGQTGTTQIRATSSYLNVLPSASLRYALTPTSSVRLVYGRGISRPDFQDLIPFTSAPSSGSAHVTESRGNPNLVAETGDDIDLLYDNQLKSVGLLQAGFFYKNLQNPIIQTLTQIPGNIFLTQSLNAGSAYIYGFEAAYQQHLTFLPGPLNGIGIAANYGYTASQAMLPPYIPNPQSGQISGPNRGPGGSTPPLLRQAPNTFNFSPTYDKRGFSIRMGLEYNQANIAAYQYDDGANSGPIQVGGGGGGLHGPNGDNYFYSHLQVDLQGSYKLPKGFSAIGYALNLNNEVFGFYNGDPSFPVQREFYRQTVGGGLRWSPTREH